MEDSFDATDARERTNADGPSRQLLREMESRNRPGPEHEVLARLIGEWEIDGRWHVVSNDPVSVTSRMRNRAVLGGQFIESQTYESGVERSRVIYGFDPGDGKFLAFAINAIVPRADFEHGYHDEDRDELRFTFLERVGPNRPPVRVDRTISFLTVDAFRLRMTYPERPAHERLGIELNARRVDPR